MTVQRKQKDIPSWLIYEMDEGTPIYYKGYQAYLNNAIQREQLMPDSDYQSWLKGKIYLLLSLLLDDSKYILTVGEHGLSLKKNSWRAIDVTVFRRDKFKLKGKYSTIPPEIAIEIDLKGEFETPLKAQKDQQRKIKQLLKFGVKKIIWIFTDTKKIKVITATEELHYNWSDDVEITDKKYLNIKKITDQYTDLFE